MARTRSSRRRRTAACSGWSKPVDIGAFNANANCRTEVSDSALTEMLAQIDRVVKEPVSDNDLSTAKSYIVGNFPTTIETPSQIAAQIGQVKLLGLDKSYLENYRKEVAKVTKADVQRVMKEHLHPDKLAVVLVGDAVAIGQGLVPAGVRALARAADVGPMRLDAGKALRQGGPGDLDARPIG